MLAVLYYFLQVILCSALLMGYYWLVLRNNRFHQYNRFYLLAAAVLSWLVPLVKIQWGRPVEISDPEIYRFFMLVARTNSQLEESLRQQRIEQLRDVLLTGIYVAVAAALLFGMIQALLRIRRLLKENACRSVEDVFLILTKANGTPFSFFRYIFWNEEIDIRTATGKQILQHELTHVKQKHSYDNLFLQLVVIFGWFNPFFWLLKKEMNMIHEFIADNKAVAEGDTASLAQMLLTAAYPQQSFHLTHPFFFSPIKRRLAMLTKTNHPRFSYLRRLVVLPLLCLVTVLFAFRDKEKNQPVTLSLANVVGKVVDDAKRLVLQDTELSGDSANTKISDTKLTIYSGRGSSITYQFQLKDPFGNLGRSRKVFLKDAIYQVYNGNKQLVWEEIHELHANEQGIVSCSLGTGTSTGKGIADSFGDINWSEGNFLMNTKIATPPSQEVAWWVKEDNFIDQATIPVYFSKTGDGRVVLGDRVNHPMEPQLTGENGVVKFDTVPSKGVLVAKTVPMRDMNNPEKIMAISGSKSIPDSVLFIVNGKEIPKSVFQDISPDMIESIHVLKDQSAIALYGERARNGVIQINTKKTTVPVNAPYQGVRIYKDEVEKPASFPGGEDAWRNYLSKNLNRDLPVEKGAPPGTYKVLLSFVVAEDGTVSNVEALTDPGYGTKEEAVRLMKDGHKWLPAEQNGKKVLSLTKKTITWVISDETDEQPSEKNKTRTEQQSLQGLRLQTIKDTNPNRSNSKAQIPPAFPGGLPAWSAYLMRNMDKDFALKRGAPNGKYTVTVSFIVDKDGSLSEIKADNDPGYGLSNEAERIITKGPRWMPALLNGKKVVYRHKVSLTWPVEKG
jgi:TonB-dependent SusC/RagA subfamily outer membrane receptor